MGQFDMHGGNFAPLGYLKINTGGSHEENPNGGVQIGVDPQGVPNMVEEDESIYKDFVFSDNIRAEKKFLEKNHLPVKFAGKLYSEITDKFVDEAEDRPNDPISNNGLNEMLIRLAQAQEEQKAEKEQRELENELSNLSPEELEQLEAMLAQGGEELGEAPGVIGTPEQMVPAMPVEQAPMQTIPMMAEGGPLKTYDDLASEILAESQNPGPVRASGIGNTDLPLIGEHPEMDVALAAIQPGSVATKLIAPSVYKGMINGIANGEGAMALMPFVGGVGKYMKEADAIKSNTAKYAGKTWDKAREILTEQEALDDIVKDAETKLGNLKAEAKKASDASMFRGRIASAEADLQTAKFNAKQNVKKFDETVHRAYQSESPVKTGPEQKVKSESGKKAGDVVKTVFDPGRVVVSKWNPQSKAGKAMKAVTHGAGTVAAYDLGYIPLAGAIYGNGLKPAHDYVTREYFPEKVEKKYVEGNDMDSLFDENVQTGDALDELFANGGKMTNKYELGGDPDYWRPGGMWTGLRSFPAPNKVEEEAVESVTLPFSTTLNLSNSGPLYDFSDGTSYRPKDVNLGMPVFTVRRPETKQTYNPSLGGVFYDFRTDSGYRPKDATLGMPDFKFRAPNEFLTSDTLFRAGSGDTRMFKDVYGNVVVEPAKFVAVSSDSPAEQSGNAYVPLPTAGRYAKALGAAALGLYDLAQEPYKYQFPEIHPQAPWGTVNYQPLVYNPMDWAMASNALSAQTNGALRALRGTGPSQGRNVIALDKNATEAQGNALNQIWNANNQHRNEIIAGNNQTEGQRAGFDYGVSRDRASMFDQNAWMNFQKEMYRQRWNQDEETAKYQALSNQIGAGLDAAKEIANENFRMNQINSNTALQGYQLVPNGMGGYKLVSLGKCGGTLLKKYKK